MSFRLDGNPTHIEHLWMPQGNGWSDDILFALVGIGGFVNPMLHDENTFAVSEKVDDAMSMVVGVQDGSIVVGYKGSKSPLVSNFNDIATSYENPGVILKLQRIFWHVRELLDAAGVSGDGLLQVGFMGDLDPPYPEVIVPNVVPYRLDENRIGRDVAVCVYGKMESRDSTLEPVPWVGHTDCVYVWNNTLDVDRFVGRPDQDVVDAMFVSIVDEHRTVTDEIGPYSSPYDAVDVNDDLRAYLNGLNRDGWGRGPGIPEYVDFLEGRLVDKVASLKTKTARNRWTDRYRSTVTHVRENHSDYVETFSMVDRLKRLSDALASRSSGEGFVIEGSGLTFKVVNPSFTQANHERWSR